MSTVEKDIWLKLLGTLSIFIVSYHEEGDIFICFVFKLIYLKSMVMSIISVLIIHTILN